MLDMSGSGALRAGGRGLCHLHTLLRHRRLLQLRAPARGDRCPHPGATSPGRRTGAPARRRLAAAGRGGRSGPGDPGALTPQASSVVPVSVVPVSVVPVSVVPVSVVSVSFSTETASPKAAFAAGTPA